MVIKPVATAPFAANIVPAAIEPKCINPRNCLPHHVRVSIGLSYEPKGVQSGLYSPVSCLCLCISPDSASNVRSGNVANDEAVSCNPPDKIDCPSFMRALAPHVSALRGSKYSSSACCSTACSCCSDCSSANLRLLYSSAALFACFSRKFKSLSSNSILYFSLIIF